MAKRIDVLKTYKTYIGGAFPRSESGHTLPIRNSDDTHIANVCRCTRKDLRDAVIAARKACQNWSGRSAYNRGQILYRIAEMLEGRKSQFKDELVLLGQKERNALQEIDVAIDRLIYFAGWTDKISQVFGTVNPVASSHFNFSSPEPTGVVGIICADQTPLLSVVSAIAPVIASGNSCIVLAPESNPLPAVSFGEVLHASDVPGGVVNILTGIHSELIDHLSSHMDINAIFNTHNTSENRKLIDENASINIKRVVHYPVHSWLEETHENPYLIQEFMETKTTWHPVGF